MTERGGERVRVNSRLLGEVDFAGGLGGSGVGGLKNPGFDVRLWKKGF